MRDSRNKYGWTPRKWLIGVWRFRGAGTRKRNGKAGKAALAFSSQLKSNGWRISKCACYYHKNYGCNLKTGYTCSLATPAGKARLEIATLVVENNWKSTNGPIYYNANTPKTDENRKKSSNGRAKPKKSLIIAGHWAPYNKAKHPRTDRINIKWRNINGKQT